ncbi:Vacuolar protein sorting-associated protein, partial [Phytophthora megakarya]
LRLVHFPSSAVHYEGPAGARIKRVMYDEALPRPMIRRSNGEGGGISLRVDCKDLFLQQVRIYCTTTNTKKTSGSNARPVYEDLLPKPADLKISIEDLVSSTITLGDEVIDGSKEVETVFLPRITVNSVLPPLEAHMSRTSYLGIVALILENFGADALQNAVTTTGGISRTNSAHRLLRRRLSSANGVELPSLRPTVNYTYLQADADEATVQNPRLAVHLGAFNIRDLVGIYKQSQGSDEIGTLLTSPQPLDIGYTWDDTALTGELDLLFSEVTGTVIPEALLKLLGFFTLPSRPGGAEMLQDKNSTKLASSTPRAVPPSPSLLTRRESISDILRDGKEPDLTITVRATAKQVGVALPHDAYDPESPRVAFTGDCTLEFKWKPHPDPNKGKKEDDLDIQSSILLDARNMEVVLENARRPGCCVASPTSNERWDAIDVASLIQLLEPCSLHIEVRDLFPHAGQKQQIVALSFTPIEVFVSYDDACLALETMESLNEAITQHEKHRRVSEWQESSRRNSPALQSFARSRTFSSKSIPENATVEEEIHRYFTCELPSVSLTLINDCDGCDMGLAQLQIERCNLFLNVTYTAQEDELIENGSAFFSDADFSLPDVTTTISGGGSLVVLMAYYNPDTRDWHPMCTEWALDASVQGSISSESALHVILTASQALDLTVTHGLLEVVASVGGAWKRRAALATTKELAEESEDEETKRRKMAPCVIRNETGLPLSFWLTNGSFTTEPQVVTTSNLADVRYLHAPGRGRGVVRRYASGDRDAANLRLCLQLMDGKNSGDAVARFQAVQGLIFEQLGARTFPLLGARTFPLVDTHGQRTNFTLSLSAQLVEGRILLVVSSPIKLVNNLASSRPIALLVNDPTWHTPVEIGILQPNQESAVPVLLSLASELRVRPVGNGTTYSWSAPIPVQTRSAVELKVEAAASSTSASRESSGNRGNGRNAVYCVSMSSANEMRAVSFAEPLVLVNKLPVPLTYRVRSAYSSAYGAGASDSPSKPETIAVGGKTSIWWTDIAQRPLFQLLVEGCTTQSKWLELVPRGTANGAVLSVQLSRVDDGRPFRILLRVVGGDNAARPVRVEILAEIWVVNRSGLELVYGTAADSEAYIPPHAARAQVGNAQISAYSDDSNDKVPVVRIGLRGCNWSPRFEADPRRLSWQDECIPLRSAGISSSGGVLYELGVSADYATRHFGSVTTLISVIPRYLIFNRSSHTLLLLEAPTRQQLEGTSNDNVAHHVLGAGDMYALYWVGGSRAPLRASVLPDDDATGTFCTDGYDWSAAFAIDRVATTDLLVPPRSSGRGVQLEVVVKRGSFSQATFVVVVTDGSVDSPTSTSSRRSTSSRLSTAGSTVSSSVRDTVTNAGSAGWQTFSLHAQMAGMIVTVTDKKLGGAVEESQNLFVGGPEGESEPVARATFTKIGVEASWSPHATAAKLNLMGLKVEDLLPRSKNRVVLRPLLQSDGAARPSMEKHFLELTYLERPHAKYTWVEHVRVNLQNMKVSTSMSFVDRLNKLQQETIAHFQHKSLVSAFPGEEDFYNGESEDSDLLAYFVPQNEEGEEGSAADMAAMTGRKLYIASGQISPVRVVVSFTRGKSASRQRGKEGFWLSNLKIKIENACVTLEGYQLSHALATQESLGAAIVRFYEQSVKSQALNLIDSIEVTSLVTSMVAGGVTSLVSTLRGKADPAAAAGAMAPGMLTSSGDGDSSLGAPFRYERMSNGDIVRKHSRAVDQCSNSTEFLRQVRHLVYDWDANHTGLEARGCVVLALINNSRHSLVVNTQLNDGASLRVLPLGRRHLANRALASVLDAPSDSGGAATQSGSTTAWRADRALVVFAYGYTPTLLTSGDVYFTVQSNACNVYATRKTARLKANRGYTATFTLQETQSWWSANVVIIGDDLQANDVQDSDGSTSASDSLFGEARQDDETEYEVEFSGPSLGLIAKQSGNSVIVRECVPSSAAEASGSIAAGDCILAVNGVTVANTGSITQLPVRFKRPWKSDKKTEDVVPKVPPSLAVRDKIQAVRSKRVMEFFRAKAKRQAGARALASVVGRSTSAVLSLLRSLRHLTIGYFSRKQGKLEAEGAALLSRQFVDRVMNEVSVKISCNRERERMAKHARVIQRLWRRVKRNKQAAIDAKVRMLDMLTNLLTHLREHERTQHHILKTIHDASTNTITFCIRRAAQRLAARLIQRIWRGHCARKRVNRIRAWKMKKFLRRRQRERLRDARNALLVPSEMEQRHRREQEARMLARQQETPLLPLPRCHQRRRGERATLLDPLPMQSRPPKMSFKSRAKVQCVPFSRFEKIVAQDARVNLSNVWVAIPVRHQELPEERYDEGEWKRDELGPLLVGRGRRKRKGVLHTTYDWVPAHLLQSKEEREATASRRRQRATSPSVAKSILDF